jgi:hypothetical protein
MPQGGVIATETEEDYNELLEIGDCGWCGGL